MTDLVERINKFIFDGGGPPDHGFERTANDLLQEAADVLTAESESEMAAAHNAVMTAKEVMIAAISSAIQSFEGFTHLRVERIEIIDEFYAEWGKPPSGPRKTVRVEVCL